MTAKTIRIGLLWHSLRSGNLGVGALTLANMAIASGVCAQCGLSPEFTIIGMRDARPAYPAGSVREVMLDTRALVSPGGAWSAIGAQDCLLDIGAGDSFAEIYGFKRFAFLWLTKLQAIAQGRPLVLSPQTIGPFTRFPYPALARMVMTPAAAVVARDRMSLDALTAIAPRAKGLLAIDVAFALPYQDQSALRGGPRLRVGVNVSGMLYNEARSGRNRFGLPFDYAELMDRFIAGLAQRPDVEVNLLTHVVEPSERVDDDGQVADALAAAWPGAVRVPDFAGPSEAKSFISGLDFLVSGRMHACIAAFSSGTPVVPVSYSRKFTGLFGLLDYPHLIPPTGMGLDEALAFLERSLADRGPLARDIAAAGPGIERGLNAYRDVLRDVFTSCGGRP